MTADVRDRAREPKPPKIGMYVAVLLEIGMVAVFVADHSVVGVLLALAYAWFSATWSLFAAIFRGPTE